VEHASRSNLHNDEKEKLKNLIERRWREAQRPIHAAAYALHPENARADLSVSPELYEGVE